MSIMPVELLESRLADIQRRRARVIQERDEARAIMLRYSEELGELEELIKQYENAIYKIH